MADSIFLTDGNGTITGLVEGRNYSGELIIPEYIGSERIINIGEEAFFGYQLTSVALPNSVINIMANAFCSCSDLKSITTPSNLITIGAGAFVSCWELTSIIIPDSINTIGYGAFVDCPKLTVIYVSNPNNIPDAVSSYDWSGTGSSVTFAKYVNRDIDYIIKSGALIDIADKIRVLNGTDEIMTPAEMKTTLDTHNTEMNQVLLDQDNLIAQIATALEGKCGAGASMTCIATINDVLESLESIKDINGNSILVNNNSIDISSYVGEIIKIKVVLSHTVDVIIDKNGISVPVLYDEQSGSFETYYFIVPNYNITIEIV